MSKRARLAELLGQLPPTAMVPVQWVREQLDAEPVEDTSAIGDLSLEAAAAEVHRATSTVRGWCSSGALRGAYKLRGRDWFIPRPALRAFLDSQRPTPEEPPPDEGAVDLGAWRNVVSNRRQSAP